MSVIAEFVYLKQKESNEPEADRANWNKGAQTKKLTWKMIKKELFSKEESKEESEDEDEPCQGFDNLEDEASTDDEASSDGEEGAKAAPPSRRGSQYRFSWFFFSLLLPSEISQFPLPSKEIIAVILRNLGMNTGTFLILIFYIENSACTGEASEKLDLMLLSNISS